MSGCDCGNLDTCGCCEVPGGHTPLPVENAPGLPELAFRVGTQSAFKHTMLERLVDAGADARPLSALTTRDDADPTIGLIDAWACVLDVLTFYQERIVNEGFLRTATERQSIRELAGAIGYQLAPGAAAVAHLAFELETAEGGPQVVSVGSGVKVQSIPGPGELPQTFETLEQIEARPQWNALRPQVTEAQNLVLGTQRVFLAGTANVKRGDLLLLVGDERLHNDASERWDVRRVESVQLDPAGQYTAVGWTEGLGAAWSGGSVSPAGPSARAYVLRTRAALFGGNAPDARTLPDALVKLLGSSTGADWSNLTLGVIRGSVATPTIFLDAIYPQFVVGGWVALTHPDYTELYSIAEAADDARTGYAITAKTTRLLLAGEDLDLRFGSKVRETTVWGGADEVPLVRAQVSGDVGGAGQLSIPLEGPMPTLPGGRPVIVTGIDAATHQQVIELAWTDKPAGAATMQTALLLRAPLLHEYVRGSVTIAANVALASHGETRNEILGSGDAATPFQRFGLKGAPLTYVPSDDSPTGAISTLEVRVGDVEWHERRDLYGAGARQRAYMVRIDDSGAATVEFGDGVTGARLPSGVENVRAHYRVGTGLGGLVRAGQLSLLTNPPLGVKRVKNPFAATGASDPEAADGAREHAPLTVRTLDRTVSVDDFEDFAGAFAGVGKAQASWLWSGEHHMIVLTLAAADGTPLESSSVTFDKLQKALPASGEPRRRLRLVGFRPKFFQVTARLVVDPDYEPSLVVANAETRLRDLLAFEHRMFSQPVAQSEIEAAIQNVQGVVGVDLTKLDLVGGTLVAPLLTAAGASVELGVVTGAELLQVAPDGITVAAQ